jgi:uncharacterized membrane protein
VIRPTLVPAVACALLLAACGGASQTSTAQGSATGATAAGCADNGWTGLTYSSFGQSFVARHCITCHSASSADRRGAPPGVDFDSLSGIQAHALRIDELAGMNISGTVRNTVMPPAIAPAFPTDEQRQQLACWIAAGLP